MAQDILQKKLADYCQSEIYPLHMPGHKRQVCPAPGLPYTWDVTEVPATDDLHHPTGMLKESMAQAAELWGSEHCYYLVNGSTCGILAGIRSIAPTGSKILVARNCHKSVWHAVELCRLNAVSLWPAVAEGWDIFGSITPAQVADGLAAHPDCRLVVITSPTYEGVLSDIAGIAALCHSHGIPLMVDEAHGAHLDLTPYWTGGAVKAGADLVIQSAHKTLPSLTQTALAHLQGDLVSPAAFARQLNIFETSSPSYPLLASLDGCVSLLQANRAAWGDRLAAALAAFDREIASLQHLKVLCHGADRTPPHPAIFAQDATRLTVWGGGAISGGELCRRLREEYGFEMEMESLHYAIAIAALCDDPQALRRFGRALAEIDQSLGEGAPAPAVLLPTPAPCAMTIGEAADRPQTLLPLAEAEGKICGEYAWIYPPGIPLLLPGEVITADAIALLAAAEAAGANLLQTAGKNSCVSVLCP